jgi:hypothetical protein
MLCSLQPQASHQPLSHSLTAYFLTVPILFSSPKGPTEHCAEAHEQRTPLGGSRALEKGNLPGTAPLIHTAAPTRVCSIPGLCALGCCLPAAPPPREAAVWASPTLLFTSLCV